MLPLGGQRGDYVGGSGRTPGCMLVPRSAEKYHLDKRAHHAGQRLHDLTCVVRETPTMGILWQGPRLAHVLMGTRLFMMTVYALVQPGSLPGLVDH
jgi:hypothetical protein